MEEKMREYLESRDKLATEACLRLTEVIDAFNVFTDRLVRDAEESDAVDGYSIIHYILDDEEFKNLMKAVYEADRFMADGEEENND